MKTYAWLAVLIMVGMTLFSVTADAAILWKDDFNRADNAVVGTGWTETEGAGCSASISGNRLALQDGSGTAGVDIYHQITNFSTNTTIYYDLCVKQISYWMTGLSTSSGTFFADWTKVVSTVQTDATSLSKLYNFDGVTLTQLYTPTVDGSCYRVAQYGFSGSNPTTSRILINGTDTAVTGSTTAGALTSPYWHATTNNGGTGYTLYIDNYCAVNETTTWNDCFAIPTFSATAANNITGASISIFNATLTQGGVSSTYSTTNGTVSTGLTTGIYNITVASENYTSSSYRNWNISSPLAASLTPQAYLNTPVSTSPVYELTEQTFTIKVNTTTDVSAISASLRYNGTNYAAIGSSGTNHTNFSVKLITPGVVSSVAIPYNWTVSYTVPQGNKSQVSSGSQTVNRVTETMSYSNSTIESDVAFFYLTIPINANISTVLPAIVRNGTTLVTSLFSQNSTAAIYLANATNPVAPPPNYTISWNYTLTANDGTATTHTGTALQVINTFFLTNCSTYSTNRLINFSVNNYDTRAVLNGSMSGYYRVWTSNPAVYKEFNLSWGPNIQMGLCADQAGKRFDAYAQILFWDSIFPSSKYSYYLVNLTANSSQTMILPLYLQNGTTYVTITVVDEDSDPVENVYVKAMPYDISTNSYATTEVGKTGTDGTTVLSLVPYIVPYKFVIYNDTATLLDTTPIYIITNERTFTLSSATSFSTTITSVTETSCSVTFNNNTGNFNYVWNNVDGSVTRACLKVLRYYGSSSTVLNESCVPSTAGSILVGPINTTGNIGTFVGRGTIYIGGTEYACGSPRSAYSDTIPQQYAKTGLFVAMLIFLCLVGVSLALDPHLAAGVVIMSIVALIISMAMKLIAVRWETITGMVIAAAIIIYRLKRR